jgi:hypothetical protein
MYTQSDRSISICTEISLYLRAKFILRIIKFLAKLTFWETSIVAIFIIIASQRYIHTYTIFTCDLFIEGSKGKADLVLI